MTREAEPLLLVWAVRGRDCTVRPGPHDMCDPATRLILAVDYTLGRMTYAVSDEARAVARDCAVLTEEQRVEMADQIGSAIAAGRAGMDMDVREWQHALNALTSAAGERMNESSVNPGEST